MIWDFTINIPSINKVICGVDSIETMPNVPDDWVDFILTDPPYDLEKEVMEYLHDQFLRISKNGYITFCPPENQWPRVDKYLFWVKPISTKNTSKNYSRFVEMMFINGPVKWFPGRHWSQYTNVFTDLVDDTKKHLYRKPPSMIERLLRNHTEKGDTVFDPFAGSGVVGEVCKRINRHHYSFELETKYE